MEVSIILARFWGSLFMILGALSLGANFLGRVIGYTEDKTITIATGYITFLLGLVTVVLHNVWVADWRVSITILGWITLIKGIEKIGFPDRVHRWAQRFKSGMALWSVIIFLLGAGFFWMSLSSSAPATNGTDTSSWQLYRNDTLGFSLRFPPPWNGYTVNEGEYPTYRYVGFSFSDTPQPFEIFKIVRYSTEEWKRVGTIIPFVVLDATLDPPLVCDGCCTAGGDSTGGGQFDAFQQERCKEVPAILGTFESTRNR